MMDRGCLLLSIIRMSNFENRSDYTEQDVINAMFRDKKVTTYEDAFAHLNNIKLTKQNAFLFCKRLKR